MLVAEVELAGPEQVEAAVAAVAAVRAEAAALPAHVRAEALSHVSARLGERADEVARLITAESGKPLMWSRVEVARAAATFRWAAEEARRWRGELQRLDTDAGGSGRMAVVRRFPRGPVLGISPFNFPLNLVAHKVAPAIAVGTPIVLKPAPKTPLSALLLAEILAGDRASRWHGHGPRRSRCGGTGAGRRPAAAGGLVHRVGPGRHRRSARPCRTST